MTQARVRAGVLVAACVLAACGKDGEEGEYVRFNHPDDGVEVRVGDDADPADAVVELRSTTGETTIGTVVVSPGGGPVGTEHRVVVRVDVAFEESVDRVRVDADAGERGVEAFRLDNDSANQGVWVADLVSYGEAGETRTDRFELALFEFVEDPLPDDVEETE